MNLRRNMTRRILATLLAEKIGLPQRDCSCIVDCIISTIRDTLEEGEEVKMLHFGTFRVLNKHARIGRNPKTNREMLITPRQMVAFRPCNGLRRRLNGQK